MGGGYILESADTRSATQLESLPMNYEALRYLRGKNTTGSKMTGDDGTGNMPRFPDFQQFKEMLTSRAQP